jgi:hypothetical protein
MSRIYLAIGFVVAAGVLWLASGDRKPPAPGPDPAPAGLDLRGLFIGPTAADDSSTFGALCDELAAVVDHDGSREGGPRLKTGVQFDDLRVAACDGRMRGVSIGARQPKVREAIKAYLEQAVGTSGGPVSVETRRAWVDAYRSIARACADATR